MNASIDLNLKTLFYLLHLPIFDNEENEKEMTAIIQLTHGVLSFSEDMRI